MLSSPAYFTPLRDLSRLVLNYGSSERARARASALEVLSCSALASAVQGDSKVGLQSWVGAFFFLAHVFLLLSSGADKVKM